MDEGDFIDDKAHRPLTGSVSGNFIGSSEASTSSIGSCDSTRGSRGAVGSSVTSSGSDDFSGSSVTSSGPDGFSASSLTSSRTSSSSIGVSGSSVTSSGSLNSSDASVVVGGSTEPSEMGSASRRRARRNWSVFSVRLRDFLHKTNVTSSSSATPPQKLILFDTATQHDVDSSATVWTVISDASGRELIRFSRDSRHPTTPSTLESLATGFDNTGNVRVWPGSEALTFVALRCPQITSASSFLELGAGFLGLTSFVLARQSPTARFWVTDGNPTSVESLRRIAVENGLDSSRITVSHLIWHQKPVKTERFDVILAADCVFFADGHEPLLQCIFSNLAENGTCWMASPRRKGSLATFCEHVRRFWSEKLELRVEEHWNRVLEQRIAEWDSHAERDEQLPVILTLNSKNQELKGALQLGVLKESDSVAVRVGERNGLELRFEPDVVQSVAALVWDTVAEHWADDLARFAGHAGRQRVQTDDVGLLTRRNPELMSAALKLAGIAEKNAVEAKTGGKGGRKRKNNGTSPQKAPKMRAHSISPDYTLDVSRIKTPGVVVGGGAKRPMLTSSTPKTVSRPLQFSQEITPIRPTDDGAIRFSSLLNEIEEVTLEEEDGSASMSTSTTLKNTTEHRTTCSSSVLKAAENHVEVDETRNAELERLEALVPPDEEEEVEEEPQMDSFDEFFEQEAKKRSGSGKKSSSGRPNASGSSIKPFSFYNDSDDDSFDGCVPEKGRKAAKTPATTTGNSTLVVPETPKTTSRNSSKNAPKNATTTPVSSRKNRSLQQQRKMTKNDSFDDFDFDI